MKEYAVKLCDTGKIAVDDTILIKDAETTSGSRILEGFKSLFSAEAVTRLEEKGYKIAGKTHVGEFGLDLVGEFSYYASQEGTLSGAAATLVEKGEVKAALGVDMNGATRRAAALAGVDFLKPTYGTVSRYGVVSCAASGEQIGVYARNTEDIKEIMEVIAGHDEKDGTSLKDESYTYEVTEDIKDKKVLLVSSLFSKADKAVQEKVTTFAETLRTHGVTVTEADCDLFEIANTAWQILMSAETCNNISRYDGVKFGHRAKNYKNIDELYVNSRTEGFNFLTKAVILYGSDVLSKNRYKDCYDKSLRVRRVVADGMKKLFETYDAVLTPVTSTETYAAYDIREAFGKVFSESEFTALPNLIGLPALSCGGVQLVGKHFGESTLLSLAHAVEGRNA